MRTMFVIIVLALLGGAGFLAWYVRTVDHDPSVWHVDPLQVPPSETPNAFRVAPPQATEWPVQMEAPIYEADAETLARAFDDFVMVQPRVERVAGTVEEGWLTYVQRTPQLRVPDYISVRFYDLDAAAAEPEADDQAAADASGGAQVAPEETAAEEPVAEPEPRATIAIYSRSRFGYSDMGVNEERVRDWLNALESFEE